MDNISNLTHAEAGQYIKKLLDFFFRDKQFDDLATDKISSILLLLSDDFQTEKERELQGIHTPTSSERRFTFKSNYANIFFCLKDSEAGILIKQICDYMFGSNLISAEESKAVTSYYSALKRQLVKSKTQSDNAKKRISKAVTLDKIRSDFPFISGSLRTDNPILEGVNLSELYDFIKANAATLQGVSMYSVVTKFKENRNANSLPN
jgi:hypothetical protein